MYRIAVVDDDVLAQKMMSATLAAEGFQALVLANGVAALERLPGLSPDLILLDVNLPDVDGFEVCRRLKEEPGLRAVPVIMLTGEAKAVEERVRGLDTGAEDYLFKPVSPRVLVARIRGILQAAGGARS